MARFSFTSLRVRLIFLVLMTIMPLLGLIIYNGVADHRLYRSIAFQNALNLAINVSQVQNNIVEDAKKLLSILSQMLKMHQLDPGASLPAVFGDIIKKYPVYTAFVIANPDGTVVASVPPAAQPLSISHRSYYHSLIQTKDFVIGEYMIGNITGKAILPLAYPILDDAGQLQTILICGLDLTWLNQYLSKIKFPPEASLNVIDNKGTILLRYPNPERFVGKSMPEEQIVKRILTGGEGVEEGPDLDGVPRLYGFTSFGQPYGVVFVSVGIPKKIAFAAANRNTFRNFAWLTVAALLGFIAAWFGADIFVIRPVNSLLTTTKMLAEGDLTVRTGGPYGQGEIAQLAYAFNQMAESLELREAERQRTEKELLESEKKYRTLFEESRDAIYITSREGKFINANQSTFDLFGYSKEEMIGQSVLMIYGNPADRKVFQQKIEKNGFVRDYELKFRRKDGSELDCFVTSTVRLGRDGSVLGYEGIIRDITKNKQTEARLRYLSTHDVLTGLYNRAFFEEEMARIERGRHFPVSVIMVDVDNLKATNDSLGHATGDELLRRTAAVLAVSFRAEDVVARIGGDEFAMVLPNTDTSATSEVLKRISDKLAEYNATHKEAPLKLSLGSTTAKKGETLAEAMKLADKRMYEAKHGKR